MSRSVALTCAAVLFCALAGCSFHPFFMRAYDDGRKRYELGIDDIAAAIILREYLDRTQARSGARG